MKANINLTAIPRNVFQNREELRRLRYGRLLLVDGTAMTAIMPMILMPDRAAVDLEGLFRLAGEGTCLPPRTADDSLEVELCERSTERGIVFAALGTSTCHLSKRDIAAIYQVGEPDSVLYLVILRDGLIVHRD